MTEARSAAFLQLLQDLAIEVDMGAAQHARESTLQLARRFGLSAYDAAYLDLALREGLPLATLDAGLLNAAAATGVTRVRAFRPPTTFGDRLDAAALPCRHRDKGAALLDAQCARRGITGRARLRRSAPWRSSRHRLLRNGAPSHAHAPQAKGMDCHAPSGLAMTRKPRQVPTPLLRHREARSVVALHPVQPDPGTATLRGLCAALIMCEQPTRDNLP